MLKGIKIKKNQNTQTKQTLFQQLQQCHKNLIELVAEGYPQTQAVVQKIHQLEQQYFKQNKNNSNNIMQKYEQVVNHFDPINRVDVERYQQQKKPNRRGKQKEFKFLSNKKIDSCKICPQNEEVCVVSSSNSVYLAINKRKQFQKYFHFMICPIEHIGSFLALESTVIDEINNYKKCLIHMFESVNYHPVFFETFSNKNSHLVIECLAVPSKRASDFPFYFKQGLEGCEGDWGTNKNIIRIEKQKGGILKDIPKNFRYFYIDFSLGYGYAHIIEDQRNWKLNFPFEIIASILGMQKHEVLTFEQYEEEQLSKRIDKFEGFWKDYDWTAL